MAPASADSSAAFVSCRQTMSGATRSRNPSTPASRARSEFRFQVAIRSRSGAGPAGDIDGRNASAANRRSSRAACRSFETEPPSLTSAVYP